MKAILIGSAVYKKEPLDYDFVSDQEFVDSLSKGFKNSSIQGESERGRSYLLTDDNFIVEVFVPQENSAHHLLLEEEHEESRKIFDHNIFIPHFKWLAALKKAHLILPYKWDKHIEEYRFLKNKLNVERFSPKDFKVSKIFKRHRKECLSKAKNHPKLNVKKDSFFEEAEFKIFDHDTIHKAVALGDCPAYTLMQDGEVWCSKKKWNLMSQEDKLRCVIEEASVLALERSIIPFLFLKNKKYNGQDWAYQYALQKISTTITSGWFREYCIESYHQALKNKPDFTSMFFDGLRKGVVKKH